MPLYEGIGLISEKHAVVLDIGVAYTKCGYAGEMSPRCIIPSVTSNRVVLHDCTSPNDLYNALVDFIHHLYFKWLLVNPKDRRVVVVESIIGSTMFRDTLAKVLFRHYEVSSVLFVPSHLMPLFSLGVHTALVLDVGHRESTLIPIYEGVPVLAAWQAQPLAGEAVQAAIKADLICRGVVTSGGEDDPGRPIGEEPQLLTREVVEDVLVRCCFITTLQRGREVSQLLQGGSDETSLATWMKDAPPPVRYPAGGGSVMKIDGATREGAAELLWQLDQDGMSVASMVLDSILACPVDCRRKLAANLVLVGGTTMMPGFKKRLNQELRNLLTTEKYQALKLDSFKVHSPPGKPNFTTWLGGAIFGATDVVVTRSLTREQYLKDPAVPDWSNLRFNSVYNEGRQG